jgi:hypothetical protein
MTQKATEILRQLIDVNYEIETNFTISYQTKVMMLHKYMELKNQLIDEMGQLEYDKFMENGRKMFQSI